MPNYTKKMLKALEDVVFNYEQAILDLEFNDLPVEEAWEPWACYGSACPLCYTTTESCRECPIKPCHTGIARKSYQNLIDLTWNDAERAHKTVLAALKDRLRTILQLAKKNGVILK